MSWQCLKLFYSLTVIFTFIFVRHGRAALPKAFLQGGHKYDLYLTEAAMDYFNPKFLEPGGWMRVTHKGRGTAPTLNAFFPIIRELLSNTNTTWIPYQRRDGKWMETMGAGYMPLCTILESPIEMYRSVFNFSNFPHKCPVPPGNYTITDFKFDTRYMPPYLPGNEWDIRIVWLLGNQVIGNFRIGFKIDRTKEMRGKGHKAGNH